MGDTLSLLAIDYTGTVTQVEFDNKFPDNKAFAVNDSFQGTITYDLNCINRYEGSDQYPFTAKYDMKSNDDYYGITTSINDFVFQTHPGDVLVQDNHPEYNDELRFHGEIFDNPGPGANPAIFPLGLNSSCSIKWILKEPNAGALSNLDLPKDINLALWSYNDFRIKGTCRNNGEDVYWLRIYGKINTVATQTSPSAPTNLQVKL